MPYAEKALAGSLTSVTPLAQVRDNEAMFMNALHAGSDLCTAGLGQFLARLHVQCLMCAADNWTREHGLGSCMADWFAVIDLALMSWCALPMIASP